MPVSTMEKLDKLTEEDLLLDLQTFVFEQQVGQLYESAAMRAQRAEELTERWRGTPVSVRILDIEGPSTISGGPKQDKSAHLETATGAITKISAPEGPPAPEASSTNSGFNLELDEETCVEFTLRGSITAPRDCDTGLSLTVKSENQAN